MGAPDPDDAVFGKGEEPVVSPIIAGGSLTNSFYHLEQICFEVPTCPGIKAGRQPDQAAKYWRGRVHPAANYLVDPDLDRAACHFAGKHGATRQAPPSLRGRSRHA